MRSCARPRAQPDDDGRRGACFVADALFAPDVLDKHGIPFYVDIDHTLATLASLPRWTARTPRSCPVTARSGDRSRRGRPNAARRLEIRQAVARALAGADDVGSHPTRPPTAWASPLAARSPTGSARPRCWRAWRRSRPQAGGWASSPDKLTENRAVRLASRPERNRVADKPSFGQLDSFDNSTEQIKIYYATH